MERRSGHSEGELGQEKLIYALISVLKRVLNHLLKLICRSLKDRPSVLYFRFSVLDCQEGRRLFYSKWWRKFKGQLILNMYFWKGLGYW